MDEGAAVADASVSSAAGEARVLDRRARAGGIAVVAAVSALALTHLPAAVRGIDRETAELRALAPADRPLVGAFSTDIDRGFLEQAKQVIPPGATYYVATGDRVQVSSPATLDAVAPYLGYWLLPRVQVLDPHQADWIVSYGGDPASLGVSLRRTVTVSPGLELAEVARP